MRSAIIFLLGVMTITAAHAEDYWSATAIRTIPEFGEYRHVEFAKAKSLLDCREIVLRAYAYRISGPLFCEHIKEEELISTQGAMTKVP